MSEIPKPTFAPYQSLFYGYGINYPRCKEDCYWYEEEPNMGAHIPCCQSKGGNYIEPKDCKNCEHYHSKYKKTNADRIRSMTDVEIVDFIYQKDDPWCTPNNGPCKYTDEYPFPCEDCLLSWLKEEAGEMCESD